MKKITQDDLNLIAELTKKLYELKDKANTMLQDDFKDQFQEIELMFKSNELPFLYDFYDFSKNLKFEDEQSYSTYYSSNSYSYEEFEESYEEELDKEDVQESY